MIRILISFLLFISTTLPSAFAQGDFITVWDLSLGAGSGADSVSFYVDGFSQTVNYSWTEIGGNNASGTGNIFIGDYDEWTGIRFEGVEPGGIVRLSLDLSGPKNFSFNTSVLQSFDEIPADACRLIDVLQWGTCQWSKLDYMFNYCVNLTGFSDSNPPVLSNVRSMNNMFSHAQMFNHDVSSWNVSNVQWMQNMFEGATSFNQNIGNWNLSGVKSIHSMFKNASSFNQDISGWDVSNVSNMHGVFWGATNFNQDIGVWNVSSATSMSFMFKSAPFDRDISEWNVSNVSAMAGMFWENPNFDVDISKWDVSNVTNMSHMFDSSPFNQDISDWDVSKVKATVGMFQDDTLFNQNIGGWNMSSALQTSYMFRNSTRFNQDIGSWDVSNVFQMWSMFEGATSFNQDIGDWDVSGADVMYKMFDGASSFNQDLGDWNFPIITYDLNNFFDQSGMDCSNYASTITGWVNNPSLPNGIKLGADGVNYTNDAVSKRNMLISKGWIIEGDNHVGQNCDGPSNEDETEFITIWDLSIPGVGGSDSVNFYVQVSGPLEYYWEEIGGNNSSGFGLLTVNGTQSGVRFTGISNEGIVKLRLKSGHLGRFYQKAGSNPDAKRLVELKQWGDANWTSMEHMFQGCSEFMSTAIDTPNLGLVNNMTGMFSNTKFNSPIGHWDVSSVTSMWAMFSQDSVFNQDLSNWDVSNVENMWSMFFRATSFNQDISEWDVSKVQNMYHMFSRANSFDQDLSNWELNSLHLTDHQNVTMEYCFHESGMSCENFTRSLIGWAQNSNISNDVIVFGASYGNEANNAVSYLESLGWSVGGKSGNNCLNQTDSCTSTLSIVSDTILCGGQYLTSLGELIYSSGIYHDTLESTGGCDSLIEYQLTFESYVTKQLEIEGCEAVSLPSGAIILHSGVYADTVAYSSSCDTIYEVEVIIELPTIIPQTLSACKPIFSPSGKELLVTGQYRDTIATNQLCDSIYEISFELLEPDFNVLDTQSIIACSPYLLPSGAVINSTGSFLDTTYNSKQCPEVYMYNAVFGEPSLNILDVAACGVFIAPNGDSYFETGTYYNQFTNASGCDSLIKINLTITNHVVDTVDVTACGFYITPGEKVYYESGLYVDTAHYPFACDTIKHINLMILENSLVRKEMDNCDFVVTGESNFHFKTGIYYDTLKTLAGCDSILRLEFNTPNLDLDTTYINSCEPLLLNGGYEILTPGFYLDTIVTSGCGVLLPVIYTNPPLVFDTVPYTICEPTYIADSILVSGTGFYYDTIPGYELCDTLKVYAVEMLDSIYAPIRTEGLVLTLLGVYDHIQWLDCAKNFELIVGANASIYTGLLNGSYAAQVEVAGCIDTTDCYSLTISSVESTISNMDYISVYPNPTNSSRITATNLPTENVEIKIFSNDGKLLRTTFSGAKSKLEISLDHTPGIYIVQFKSNTGITRKRISKL